MPSNIVASLATIICLLHLRRLKILLDGSKPRRILPAIADSHPHVTGCLGSQSLRNPEHAMLTGFSQKIELAANLAILVVACLLATVLAKNYLLAKPFDPVASRSNAVSQPLRESPIKIGVKLSSAEMEFAGPGQTLILAISSTCHFCTESAPFYKKLGQSKRNIRLVAVLPQPVEDGRKYLDRLGCLR